MHTSKFEYHKIMFPVLQLSQNIVSTWQATFKYLAFIRQQAPTLTRHHASEDSVKLSPNLNDVSTTSLRA